MEFKNKFIVNRKDYEPVSVKVKIKNNNIYIDIEKNKEIHFLDFAHLLIENTPILDIIYQRSAPYKLIKTKHKKHDKFTHKSYSLSCIVFKEGSYQEQTKHILDLYTVNTKVKGKLIVFIPDLFLVMQDNGYIKEVTNGKYEAARTFSEHVTFEYNKYTPEYLKSMGYIVPKKYEMWR